MFQKKTKIMRRIITSNLVSLDGYLAGPGGDLSWHTVNDEFFGYAEDMLNSAGVLLFGRITYDLMASYWPTETVRKNDPVVAGKMNGLPKIVFSKTLEKAEWENTTLFNGDVEKNIRQLKEQPGKDIVILGSGTVVSALTQADLIDEYRFIINPVILGSGVYQFTGNVGRKKMELTDVKQFSTGVVILCYKPTI
jgi:dihydrofolate reductase